RERPLITQGKSGSGPVMAVSDQMRADAGVVVASYHEQPVPIFQQFAGGYPSGRDECTCDIRCHGWPSAAAHVRLPIFSTASGACGTRWSISSIPMGTTAGSIRLNGESIW